MQIALASDHAGFKTKEALKDFLESLGHEVIDFGPEDINRVDYPDFAKKIALHIQKKKAIYGILVCGSGIGMAMAANRYQGVRAAVLRTLDDAHLSREHNNANIACLGERLNTFDEIKSMLKIFLGTDFVGGRHQSRVEKIE